MKFFCHACLLVLTALALTRCGGSEVTRRDPSQPGLTTAHDLDFKDYQMAAESMINSLLTSAVFNRDDGLKPILSVYEIQNKTLQHLDTELLTGKIRIALNKSGKALTTTAVGVGGPEDPTTAKVQDDLQGNARVDQSTVPEAGRVVAPNFSLSGTILQKKTRDGRDSESYFYFHLVLTDLKTGLAMWEDETEIVKQQEKKLFGF